MQGDYVWGRGALDMKGGVAMMMDAFMRAHLEDVELPGDVILALVTDEEAGGHTGAEWLVDTRPELFDGVRYGIGEFGGFSKTYRGRKFYMVQVAEKARLPRTGDCPRAGRTRLAGASRYRADAHGRVPGEA